MALVDLNEVVNDPDLAEPFTLLRTTGNFVQGGYQPNRTQAIASFGVISSPSGEELKQIPEGDRVEGMITIHTQNEIKETNPNGISDVVLWLGQKYRVIKVWKYANRNFWYAIAGRMAGE